MKFNPEVLARNMLTQNNPILNNLMQLIEQGKNDEVINFARNFLKQKGYNFDEELKKIQNNPITYMKSFK